MFDSYITDFRNIIGTNDIMDILMIENITEIIDISDTKNIMDVERGDGSYDSTSLFLYIRQLL